MRLPQANARLTAVTAKGFTEDWDDAGTTGSARWTGTADAYVQTDVASARDGSRESTVEARSVVLPSGIPVQVGDRLGLVYQRTSVTWPVVGVIARTAPPGVAGTTLVTVEPG